MDHLHSDRTKACADHRRKAPLLEFAPNARCDDRYDEIASVPVMSKETAFILIRWVIALTFLVKGALLLVGTAGGEGGSFAGSAANALFAFALIIGGVLLSTRELVPWVSAPIWRFITGLVFPDDKFDKPPVNYALARSYKQQHRVDDAIEEYFKIVYHHPQELAAYLEGMEVLCEAGDLPGAHKLGATGLRRLRAKDARKEVKAKMDLLLESAPGSAVTRE